MYRFQTSPQRTPGKKLWVSLLLFLFLILLFTLGTSSLSENTVRRQKESLTQALNRDITYCYATTGRYPESLEAIKKDYGLMTIPSFLWTTGPRAPIFIRKLRS